MESSIFLKKEQFVQSVDIEISIFPKNGAVDTLIHLLLLHCLYSPKKEAMYNNSILKMNMIFLDVIFECIM